MTRAKKYVFFLIFFFGSLVLANQAKAEDFVCLRQLNLISQAEQTVSSPNQEVSLKVSLRNGINSKPIIKMMNLASKGIIGNFFTYPSEVSPASDLYFVRTSFVGLDRTITLKYEKDAFFKQVYSYNWINLSFEKVSSVRDEVNQTLTFALPEKEEFIFALFNEPEIIGLASWYVHPKYPGKLIAASRDLALDSKIKVQNKDESKEVILTVKDFGPKKCSDWTEEENIKMGPCRERVIDLSKEAFSILSPLGAGVIEVKVTPL